MGWSGGNYTKGNAATGGWVGDASLGIGIEAGRHDTQDNDFATGINNCIAKDGQNAATADLPMGGFKHTNVANATARNNYAAVGQVQDGDFVWLGTAGGTATALTASASPAITAYKAGQKFRLITASGSTGSVATAHTININSIGAKNIVNNEDSTNPTIGTWIAGALMELVYDGTNFRITNDPGGWLSYTPTLTANTGSVSSVVVTLARYRKIAQILTVNYFIVFNTTTAGDRIRVSLPINQNLGLSNWRTIGLINDGTATVATTVFADTATDLAFFVNVAGSSSWGTKTGCAIYGTYTIETV